MSQIAAEVVVPKRGGFLQRVGEVSARISTHLIPDAFVFAILLSALVFLLGIWLTPNSGTDMIEHWYSGFWNFLGFSMQMVLVLVTGYVLAQSPPARRGLKKLATLPRTATQAVVLISLVTLLAGFINWGLGLIIGAVFAISVARDLKARGIKLHFPLAAAAGYLGLSIHSAGFSSTAPLIVNTDDHFLFEHIGQISFLETVLTPWNLIAVAIYFIVIPIILKGMHPRDEEVKEIDIADDADLVVDGESRDAAAENKQEKGLPLAQRLENSWLLTAMVVVPGFGYVVYFFATRGFDLNINIVNFSFLLAGMALYKTPIAYVRAIGDAASSAGGIILQFPFYAGILGMMSLSGLVTVLSDAMISISTQYTYPFLAMFSAAIVNIAVPSAGGQWGVQGQILVESAQAMDIPVTVVIMAHQYGDQITNMIQPFWALPLLGLTGLRAKDVLGYTAIVMFAGFAIFGVAITAAPFFM